MINDHSRYAYVECHRDQGGDTAAAVLSRAVEHFAALGMKAPEAVMSDNAFAYRRSNAFREQLAAHGARHILTPPYTAALEREGGALHPDPQARVGLCALLAQLGRASQSHGILPSLLQPASPSQLAGRPAAGQPRSQRLWVGHLVPKMEAIRGDGSISHLRLRKRRNPALERDSVRSG